MTVCIAATYNGMQNDKPPGIVFVADRRFSLGTHFTPDFTSLETGVKIWRLYGDWFVMFAGDSGPVIPISNLALKYLKEEDENQSLTSIVVQTAMLRAYQECRTETLENTYLKPLGWPSLDKFRDDAKDKLPPGIFELMLGEVKNFDLNCDFLVCGFATKKIKVPSLFYVRNPGVVQQTGLLGFGVIGDGTNNALTHFARKEQSMRLGREETLYNTVAAKILAEKAGGVGKDTIVAIFERGWERAQTLRREAIKEIRKMWQREDNFRPPKYKERMKKIIEEGFVAPSSANEQE